MSDEKLAARYRTSSTEELLRIVHPDMREEFESEAIFAAQAELDGRDLNDLSQHEVNDNIDAEISERRSKSEKSLSNIGWAIFVLIGPIFAVSLGAAILLFATGNTQKAKDALGGIVAGVFFWGLVMVAILFFNS